MSDLAQQGSTSAASLSSLPSTLGEISYLVEICSNKISDLYHQLKTREAVLQDRVDQCVHRLSVLEGQMLNISSKFEHQFNESRGDSKVDRDAMLGADGSAYQSASSVKAFIQEAVDAQISHRIKDLVEKTVSEDYMQDLVKRIMVLEAQANATHAAGSPTSLDKHSDRTTATHNLDIADVKREAIEGNTHAMQGNVWEAAILAGLGFLRTRDSVSLILSFLVNIILQMTFLAIVGISFTESTLPDVGTVWRWREEHAHRADHILDSTRTSLARAVCDEDPALITSNRQIRLHNTIERYTRFDVPVGAVLCAMVLIYWFMSVDKEYRNAISFLQGISRLPRSKNTEFLCTHEGVEIKTLSEPRRLFICLVGCVRISIALLLFILGAIWQAQTIDVQELLLNAAALAMVMDIDEMLFDAMTSQYVFVLINKIKPLTRPRQSSRPSKMTFLQVVGKSMNAMLILTTCVIWLLYVIPNLQTMNEIMEAMCGGNKDFVVYSNDLNIVSVTDLSSSSFNLISTSASCHQSAAVKELIGFSSYADEFTGLQNSRDIQSFESFEDFRKSSLEDQVLSFTSQQMGRLCRDYDLTVAWAIPALRSAFEVHEAASTCAGLAHRCTGPMRLVRMICPVTCGCDDPQSGLYESGPKQGCPSQICRSTDGYKARLASIPCRDYNISELSEMAAWPDLVRQIVKIRKRVNPGRVEDFDEVSDRLLAGGCPALQGVFLKRVFCEPSADYGSLRPFCPVSCSCLESGMLNPSECPTQCFTAGGTQQ